MGSAGLAAWVAYAAFAVLAAYGFASGELGVRGLLVALLACVLARVALAYVANGPSGFFSAVALMDVALVLIVFKRDVRF